MISNALTWQRPDAEMRIAEVLDAAKNGAPQRITDVDGVFEVTFKRRKTQRAADVLARGGPGD